MAERKRSNVTGAWKRTGANGEFYTGNFRKSELLEKLQGHDEMLQIIVSPVEVKTKENSPDITVSIGDDSYAMKQREGQS